MQRTALAVDLGGTNLRIAAVGEDGSIFSRAKAETPRGGSGSDVVDRIAELARECLEVAGLESAPVAIAAAIPASIDAQSGVLKQLPNLRQLEGFPFRDRLSERLGMRAILENDATAAAVGENWLGASARVDDSICVTLGTGVGGGLIFDGKPFRGKDGTAGEVGHIVVEPFGELCGCGGRGCVEQYASATAIVRIARGLGINAVSAREIADAAAEGSEPALQAFATMGSYLGIAFTSLVNVLNPEMIVVGGGVSASWDLFIGHVNAEVSVRAFREPAERVKIVRAKLGDDAGILGAARVAFSYMDRG